MRDRKRVHIMACGQRQIAHMQNLVPTRVSCDFHNKQKFIKFWLVHLNTFWDIITNLKGCLPHRKPCISWTKAAFLTLGGNADHAPTRPTLAESWGVVDSSWLVLPLVLFSMVLMEEGEGREEVGHPVCGGRERKDSVSLWTDPPTRTESQTRVKTLPSIVLRTWSVIIQTDFCELKLLSQSSTFESTETVVFNHCELFVS